MWGVGVDSFIARTDDVIASSENFSKEYILHNKCSRHSQSYTQSGVTCYTETQEQQWLNGTTKPRFMLLEQFHEKGDFQEQKQALKAASDAFPETTPLISHPNAPDSYYREYLHVTGVKDLLLCNYPGFGYQNDTFEDILFYVAIISSALIILLCFISPSMYQLAGLATVGATALFTFALLMLAQYDFDDSVNANEDKFVWSTVALSLSVVFGLYTACKSTYPGKTLRGGAVWLAATLIFASALVLFLKHDNAHEYSMATQNRWMGDMNELRLIRRDLGVRFYIWIRNLDITDDDEPIHWNAQPVAFTQWTMNTAVAFGANGLFMFLLSSHKEVGGGPVMWDPRTLGLDAAYPSHYYDQFIGATKQVSFNGKAIKELGGKLESIYRVESRPEHGCVVETIRKSHQNSEVKDEDLDVLVAEYSTKDGESLVMILNNHLARCVLLDVKFISQSVTELSADLTTSSPTLGYRNIKGDISLCAGDAKLFKIHTAYPTGCSKDFDDNNPKYLLTVIIFTVLVSTVAAIVLFFDMKSWRSGYRLLKSNPSMFKLNFS